MATYVHFGEAPLPRLFLGFQTSALYWRAVKEGRLPYPEPLDLRRLPANCAHGLREVSALDLSSLGIQLHEDGLTGNLHLQSEQIVINGHPRNITRLAPDGIAVPATGASPLHLLVPQRTQRTRQRGLIAHVETVTMPTGAFCRIDDNIAVSSPELTCLHILRGQRSLPYLELLCEWCGLYSLGPYGNARVFGRPPLTDLTRLCDFAREAHAERGSSQLAQVLPHVGERLASPRETEIFLMLILPPVLGGFGLPVPFVNQQIPLKVTAFAALSPHDFFEADLIWPDFWLIGEYDGLDDHERTAAQVAADKERRSVLAAMGYTVIVITKRDVSSVQALTRKASQIATALHVSLPTYDVSEAEAHARLFAWLFDAQHDHVPFGSGYF